MKKILFALVLLGSISPAYALSLSDMNSSTIGGGLGLVSAADGSMVSVVALHPDLGLGDFKLGLDVNILLDPTRRPAAFTPVTCRFVEYDNGQVGVRYGLLTGVNYGYGMLVDSYSTVKSGQSLFTPEQAGTKVYTKLFSPLGIYLLSTNSSVVGLRLTDTLSNDLFFGHPLILGANYMYDRDGVVTSTGTRVGANQSGYGADIGIPMIENQWDIFVEEAVLSNYGSGLSAGTRYKFSEMFDAKFAYQVLSNQFVPAYFNSTYEDSPVNLSSISNESKSGYFGSLGANLMDYFRFEGTYQSYTTASGLKSNTVLASLGMKEMQNVSLVASYAQPNFAGLSSLSADNATIKADVSYRLNSYSKAIIHYSKVYVTSTSVQESYATEISFELPVKF